jgi:hypothetical protein
MTPEEILKKYKTVAVVGASRDPEKAAHEVPAYLQEQGYKIVPINPNANEILGEKSYPSLLDLPESVAKQIEVVDIFRPPKEVPAIVQQAIELKKKYRRPFVIWMQILIINDEAAEMARKAGFEVVMNKCMMSEHKKMIDRGEI